MFKFHHYAIEAANIKEVLDFYQNVMGFRVENKVHFDGKKVLFLKLGDFRLELVEDEAAEGAGNMHLCFEIDRLHQAMQRMEAAGLSTMEGPYELENGWRTVFYTGPAGETLELLEGKVLK
ncbi:glyoxalase/bleomycin resistance/dioxygenase family protein [Neobacillus notoginsengisoli]|uniref:Glyoxalase/bleomycin resistance/dioxygenase family protein n=1 Tax=Neobacillus notoginsengisoli TaxID=1578198 RepID=A0A417YX43_9BACI|nr:VOC family protein [Neobacillus notoginsengisoli]RHW42060.1 glyoxalase/bleomycin resistance/dioxygenase family protein [Neobacillus notoginsengisoli]